MKLFALLLLASTPLFAAPPAAPVAGGFLAASGAPGTNDLTWTASITPNTTANVYRAPGTCASSGTFVKIASGLPAGGPYNDATPLVGAQCYVVTATANGVESAHSNAIDLTSTVSLPAPSQLSGHAN